MNMMNDLLGEYLDQFVLIFLDDVLIYSANIQEHCEHLRKVLNKLREHRLYAKASKCDILKTSVEFLGQTNTTRWHDSDGGEVEGCTRLGHPEECARRAVLPWICKLLPEVCQRFCCHCRSFDIPDQKGSDLAMGPLSTARLSMVEGGIMRCTNSEVSRPQPTIYSGNGCIRHRYWRCIDARSGRGTPTARIFK